MIYDIIIPDSVVLTLGNTGECPGDPHPATLVLELDALVGLLLCGRLVWPQVGPCQVGDLLNRDHFPVLPIIVLCDGRRHTWAPLFS